MAAGGNVAGISNHSNWWSNKRIYSVCIDFSANLRAT